jgi:hypothetical protein
MGGLRTLREVSALQTQDHPEAPFTLAHADHVHLLSAAAAAACVMRSFS